MDSPTSVAERRPTMPPLPQTYVSIILKLLFSLLALILAG